MTDEAFQGSEPALASAPSAAIDLASRRAVIVAARFVVADSVNLPLMMMSPDDTDDSRLHWYAERECSRIARLPRLPKERGSIGLLAIAFAGSAAERILCGVASDEALATDAPLRSLIAARLFDELEELRTAEFFAKQNAESTVYERRLAIRHLVARLVGNPLLNLAAARALLEGESA